MQAEKIPSTANTAAAIYGPFVYLARRVSLNPKIQKAPPSKKNSLFPLTKIPSPDEVQ